MTRIPYDIRFTGFDTGDGAITMAAMAEVCAAVVENAGRALGMARYARAGKVRALGATSMRVHEPEDRCLVEAAGGPDLLFMPDDELPTNTGEALQEIWDKWPGDEAIEELLEALRANKGPRG